MISSSETHRRPASSHGMFKNHLFRVQSMCWLNVSLYWILFILISKVWDTFAFQILELNSSFGTGPNHGRKFIETAKPVKIPIRRLRPPLKPNFLRVIRLSFQCYPRHPIPSLQRACSVFQMPLKILNWS